MQGEFYFMGIAGLAISLAGFAGLVTVLRRGGADWSVIDLWRLRAIVRLSFLCAFVALTPAPIFAILRNQSLAIRIVSALLTLVYILEIIGTIYRDPAAWPDRREVVIDFVLNGVFAFVNIANIVWGALGVLELSLVLRLIHPANIFVKVLTSFRPASKP